MERIGSVCRRLNFDGTLIIREAANDDDALEKAQARWNAMGYRVITVHWVQRMDASTHRVRALVAKGK